MQTKHSWYPVHVEENSRAQVRFLEEVRVRVLARTTLRSIRQRSGA